jgi:hypothetical protein
MDRLEIFAYTPEISRVFSVEDIVAPTKTKIDRHLWLAHWAVDEFESRHLAGRVYFEDVCSLLPYFNATIAKILPWHDLFEQWYKTLSITSNSINADLITHRDQLKRIEAHIRTALVPIHAFLDFRLGKPFQNLMVAYEVEGCATS